MNSPVDLRPDHLEIVLGLLRRHLPGDVKVWVFGSRANWTTKDSSDLDLALENESRLNHKLLGELKDAFEDSALPYAVDVVDLNQIGDSFRQIIESQGVPLPLDADGTKQQVRLADHLDDGVFGNEADFTVASDRWRRAALGDLINLQLSSVDKKSKANEQAVQLCNYTDVYYNSFIHAEMDFMSATATEREIVKCSLGAGDVVITKDSEKHDDIGVPALVREDVPNLICGYHLAILRPRLSEIDGTYLFYALSTDKAQQQFHSYANGITRFGLRKADIGLVEIPLPPLADQKVISHVLSTLDDKIELNRRMNETLEAMARAIFQDWFVDFGPVRAKREGKEPYLSPELWALFPERLVPSELGEIPDGWKVKGLGDVCDKPQYGYTQSARSEPVGPKFLRITDINKKAWIEWASVPHCEIADEDFEKYRLYKGEILIARMADPGHGCMIEEEQPAVFASYLIRFRPIHKRYARYLQYWLRSDAYWELVRGRGAGTTRLSVNAKILSEFPFVAPTNAVLEQFGEQMDSLRSRIVINTKESQALAALQGVLLPKLVSGEVEAVISEAPEGNDA